MSREKKTCAHAVRSALAGRHLRALFVSRSKLLSPTGIFATFTASTAVVVSVLLPGRPRGSCCPSSVFPTSYFLQYEHDGGISTSSVVDFSEIRRRLQNDKKNASFTSALLKPEQVTGTHTRTYRLRVRRAPPRPQ